MSLLEIRDLSVRYGGRLALDQVDLDVEAGRVTGLIGPNGAGKTTLFNVVTGLERPSLGSVLFAGRDISSVPPYRRARLGLARTFQRLELFGSLNVRENIEAAAAARRRRSRSSEDPAEVAAKLLDDLGLREVADVCADTLPTGQGRLVELGRALALEPRLLLLDEPASGQDQAETERFAQVLRDIVAAGVAVLLVEHDMSLVMGVCEQVVVFEYGRLIASGTPQAIRSDPAVQAAYLGNPSKGEP